MNTTATTARPIRVLHVIQNLNYGGMERLLADLVRRLDPARFESHILALQYFGRFAEGLEEYATLHRSQPLPRWTMFWPGPVRERIRRIAPDIVHSHTGVWYKVSLAASQAGVPRIIHTEHGRRSPDPWSDRWQDGRAARHTDVVVAVSEALARQMERTVVKWTAPIRVITGGVDTDRFRPRPETGALRRELGVPPDAPIIGSIGRLEPVKGYDVMIKAFARLVEGGTEGGRPRLVIAGDGSECSRLLRLAADLGVEEWVRLPGWRDDTADLHATFALFTMSSHSEGTSVSLLEAMSAGLCPVVTRVGGNAYVLGPDLAHRLVPPDDPVALASAWRAALADLGRRALDGSTARARVLERFDVGGMVRRYEDLYTERPSRQWRPRRSDLTVSAAPESAEEPVRDCPR